MLRGRSTFASLLAGLFLLVIPVLCHASANPSILDIQEELSRPGVKLVVVEFYATWCKPCMDAIPKWQELHRKYKRSGLRFIVVSADEGLCSKADWAPDATYCDTDGILQSQFEIRDLPTSLLFSWDGNIALRSHRIEPVEKAIENYFSNTTYKIQVDQVEVVGDKYALASNPVWVRDAIVARMRERSKFDVVTEAQSSLPQKQADTCGAHFPANSNLRIRLTGDPSGERSLTLQLEKDGCIKASSQEAYKGKGLQENKASLRAAIQTAVDELLSQVIRVRALEDVDDGMQVQTFRNNFDDDGSRIENPIVDEHGYVSILSKPEGATVFINGREEGVTPFVKELMVGEYVVQVKSGALWFPARKRIQLTQDGARLTMKLGPNHGTLKVNSIPAEADIWLNGEPTGHKTPHTFSMKKTGEYKITLKKKMYFTRHVEVMLGNGKTITIDKKLKANFGHLQVNSEPSGAKVFVDGLGTGHATPATIGPLAVGSRDITLRLASHNDFRKRVNIELGETKLLDAKLTARRGLLKIEAFENLDNKHQPVIDADVKLNGLRVGRTPYKRQVLEGTYNIEVSDGDAVFKGEIKIEEGKEHLVQAQLKRPVLFGETNDSSGMLTVNSFVMVRGSKWRSSNDEVWLDNKFAGRTPLKKQVLAGTYVLEVSGSNGRFEETITIENNKNTSVSAQLVKIKTVGAPPEETTPSYKSSYSSSDSSSGTSLLYVFLGSVAGAAISGGVALVAVKSPTTKLPEKKTTKVGTKTNTKLQKPRQL